MAPETIQRTEVTQRSSPLQAAFARASGRRLPLARMLRDGGVLVVLVLLFVVLSATTDAFLTSTNLLNVLDSATPLGIIAVAGTLVIISGGFDLSAGAVYTVAAIVATLASNATSVPLGLAAGLAAGLALGCWNGAICTVGRVNHFVGTLGTSIAFGGLATVISNAQLLELHDQRLGDLYGTQILGVNVVVYIFVIFAVACAVLLNKTVLGRHMIITGGNEEAARLSGISTTRVQVAAYALSGFAAALAGLVTLAQSLSVSDQTGGNSIIFEALAAILIGGVGVSGGRAAVWRPVVGVLLLSLIYNGIDLYGLNPLYQQAAAGTIILVAVLMDAWTRMSRA
jgi:ribose transport system permease protein